MDNVVALSDENEKEVVDRVCGALRSGGLVIVPTDTVYGIVGDATNKQVIGRIFDLKGRLHHKPLPIFVHSIEMLEEFVRASRRVRSVLEEVWPGPVTIVLRSTGVLSREILGGKDTVGVRVPDYDFLRDVLEKLDFPVAETSANVSGGPAPKNLEEVLAYFGDQDDKVDLIVDGGSLTGVHSAVIDFSGESPALVREGAMSTEELRDIFKGYGFDLRLDV